VRSGASGFYRQSIPAIQLSLEKQTPEVPNDGCYYVVSQGQIKGRFRQKRQAHELYNQILKDSGYSPPHPEPPVDRDQTVERYMDELETYWLDSHKHARRGGKGRF
jgi:hypothetical protein